MLIDYTKNDVGYDQRHGGPYDRGSCDAYYGRGYNPHMYEGDTYMSARYERDLMTKEDIAAYTAGFINTNDRKDWT